MIVWLQRPMANISWEITFKIPTRIKWSHVSCLGERESKLFTVLSVNWHVSIPPTLCRVQVMNCLWMLKQLKAGLKCGCPGNFKTDTM